MEPNDSPKKTIKPDDVNVYKNKACSVPIVPLNLSADQIKPQISAPSYLNSLKENDAPPFRIPKREAKPKLLIGTMVKENDVVEMMAANDSDPTGGLHKFLGDYLVKNKVVENFHLSEKKFLVSLVKETIDYAAQRDFPAVKLACVLTIYLSTHQYFQWYYWSSPTSVWNYFKEIMIRHTVEDSPYGEEVFEPEECYDIVTHFHTIYLSALPLAHILTFGAHGIKLIWPFKPQ